MTHQITISTQDGAALEGLVRTPAGDGPFPTVVFVIGLGMNMHEWIGSFDEIAMRLVVAGFATIQFSFNTLQKDGRIVEIPVFSRARYVEDVLRWAKEQSYVDIKEIGLLAQSYGVPTAAAASLKDVRSVVFVSGVYFPYESFTRVWPSRGTILHFDGETTRHHADGSDTIVGKNFWTELKSFDQLALASQLSMPVFMIHGDQDKYCVKHEADKVYKALPNKKKKQKIFLGGDHGINEVPRPMREEFLADVVAWFQQTLSS